VLKKFFVLFIVGMLAFTAAGCSLFGDDDDDYSADSVTLKVKVEKPSAGGSIRAVAGLVNPIVHGPLVPVKKADVYIGCDQEGNGIAYWGKTDENGEYTGTLTRAENARSFIIKATKGKLAMLSIVQAGEATGDTAVEINHESTAVVLVAMNKSGVPTLNPGEIIAGLEAKNSNLTVLKDSISSFGTIINHVLEITKTADENAAETETTIVDEFITKI
jgi:hypothetical protein